MIEVLLWLTVILGYSVAILMVFRTFIFSISLLRDVPFVVSDRAFAKEAIERLDLKEGDSFVDLGSGNGYMIFLAADKLGEKGRYKGLEISKSLVWWSRFLNVFNKDRDKISFETKNFFHEDFSKYNKVYMYLTTDVSSRLIERLKKELPKGSKVVSLRFSFGEKFMKSNKVETYECKIGRKKTNLYIWDKR